MPNFNKDNFIQQFNLLFTRYHKKEFNFIYIIIYFIDRYITLNELDKHNVKQEIITSLSRTLIYRTKYYSTLIDLMQSNDKIIFYESLLKSFVEEKYINNTSLIKFMNSYFIHHYNVSEVDDNILFKTLNNIDDCIITSDTFSTYSQQDIIKPIKKYKTRIIPNPLIINRIITENNMFSYLCYYKAALNFFLTNETFTSQYGVITLDTDSPIADEIKTSIDNIITNQPLSEYIGGDDNITFSELFYDALTSNCHIKDIKIFLDSKLKAYECCYPGIKHYPAYIIEALLAKCKDNLTNKVAITSQQNNSTKLIINLSANEFHFNPSHFKSALSSYLTLTQEHRNKQLSKIHSTSRITYYNKQQSIIKSYYKSFIYDNITCDNLLPSNYFTTYFTARINEFNDIALFHCPINDVCSYYMFNNFTTNKLTFNEITSLIKNIKRKFNTSLHYIYPYQINNYHLDSLIIVINDSLDSHFSFIKRNADHFTLYDGFNHNINLSQLPFLSKEREIFKDNCIIDTLSYKVCFVCYVKDT